MKKPATMSIMAVRTRKALKRYEYVCIILKGMFPLGARTVVCVCLILCSNVPHLWQAQWVLYNDWHIFPYDIKVFS